MRIAILVSDDLYVRSFVGTGAFAALEGPDTTYLAADSLKHREDVEARGIAVRTVHDDPRRVSIRAWMRTHTMVARRGRSSTFAIKTGQLEPGERRRFKLLGLPGVRKLVERAALRRLGPNLELRGLLAELRPDVVVAPTAGTDALVNDLIEEADRAGIPSLALINGWDNLASKAGFAVLPSHLGVWGPQAVEHAQRIHGMPAERTFPLGVPTFRQHFGFDPEAHPSPYEFPYVLFAGCALPFDELTALQELDALVDREGGDLKIVYRPHPWRQRRIGPDDVTEADLKHVLLDRQVAEAYHRARGVDRSFVAADFLPDLSYYPALLGNARCVVCPLSTMTVEASIVRQNVLVLAYDDGVHPVPPSLVAQFEHFRGIDDVPNYVVCRDRADLAGAFERTLALPHDPDAREHVRMWLHQDERTYAERLGAVVERIGG